MIKGERRRKLGGGCFFRFFFSFLLVIVVFEGRNQGLAELFFKLLDLERKEERGGKLGRSFESPPAGVV